MPARRVTCRTTTRQSRTMGRSTSSIFLSKRGELTRGHHAALPYRDVPIFIGKLRAAGTITSLAFEFLILTAARSGEVLNATWSEVNTEARLWSVPSERMKAKRPHRVPLPDRALEILTKLAEAKTSEFIFPGHRSGKPLSNMAFAMLLRRMGLGDVTPHGFPFRVSRLVR